MPTPTPPAPVCDPDFPDRCSVFLDVAQPAPYAGQLLTPALAVALGQRAAGADARAALEVRTATRTAEIECRLRTALLDADLRAARAGEAIQAARAERAERAVADAQPGVLDHPLLWVLVGAGAMAGAFALARVEDVGIAR